MVAQPSPRRCLCRGIAIGALGVFAVLVVVGAVLSGRIGEILLSDCEDDFGPG
ncbi:MAG: hypothetical protein ACRDSH_02585 [Pseudonocardiaceae bacterium]